MKELLDKRGAIYSSRPEAYIPQNILSGGLRVLFMVCLPSYSVFAETSINYLAPAKSRSVEKWPTNWPVAF